MMSVEEKAALDKRLRRIAGQVGGVQRMLEADRYCVDVLLQIAAVRAALTKVGKILLRSHVETCVAKAFDGGDQQEQDDKIEELLHIFDRYGVG